MHSDFLKDLYGPSRFARHKIGGTVGQILNPIAQVGSAVTSVIPGMQPVAAGLAGLGALTSAGSAAHTAGQANTANSEGLANYQNLQGENAGYQPAESAAVKMATQPGGAYSGYTGLDPYGTQVQSDVYQSYAQQAGSAADQAAASLAADYANRGVLGGTGINTGLGQIRAGEQNQLASERQNLQVQGAQQQYNNYVNQQNATWAQLAALQPDLLYSSNLMTNGIGGQESILNQQANQQAGQVGSALGSLGTAVGSLFSPSGSTNAQGGSYPTDGTTIQNGANGQISVSPSASSWPGQQGNNTLGTNQSASSPWSELTGMGLPLSGTPQAALGLGWGY